MSDSAIETLKFVIASAPSSAELAKLAAKEPGLRFLTRLPGSAPATVAKGGILPPPSRFTADETLETLARKVERAFEFSRTTNPADLTSGIGRQMANEIEAAAKENSALQKELESVGVIGKDGKVLGNPKALTKAEARIARPRSHTVLFKSQLFDTTDTLARNVVRNAVADVADEGARKQLFDALNVVHGFRDPEELARQVVQRAKVAPHFSKQFFQNVQIRGCEQLVETLSEAARALRSGKLATEAERTLPDLLEKDLEEELKRGTPSIANLRKKLSVRAPALLEAVTGQINVDQVIKAVLEASVQGEVGKRVLNEAFDDEGLRRLFANVGSFRKLYTVSQSMAAGQSLFGWLFEATKFNKRIMREETVKFTKRLTDALDALGIKIHVGEPTLNFNVMLNSKQATDHLSHLELTGPKGKTRVVAVAGEHKGITTIGEGEDQIVSMAKNYKGKTVFTETHELKVGIDLHLDLTKALKAVGISEVDVAKVMKQMNVAVGEPTYQRVIIFPPANEAGKKYDKVINNIRRVAHEVTRAEMNEVYQSLTLFFNLFPRRFD